MSLPKVEEVRELSDQDLSDEIASVKKELFQLRFQKATRQMEKPHQFKHLRHKLAQLMTVERNGSLKQLRIYKQVHGGLSCNGS